MRIGIDTRQTHLINNFQFRMHHMLDALYLTIIISIFVLIPAGLSFFAGLSFAFAFLFSLFLLISFMLREALWPAVLGLVPAFAVTVFAASFGGLMSYLFHIEPRPQSKPVWLAIVAALIVALMLKAIYPIFARYY
jgi:hypothetical protein